MATVVLAVAASGVILPFAGGAAVQAEGSRRTLAAKLASDLLEEIAAADFNDVPSYDGYSESAGQVKKVTGQIFADPVYSDFSRSATCQAADVANVPLFWATVRVDYRNREVVRLGTLVGR